MNKTKILVGILPLALLAGCGGGQTAEVAIEDGQITTIVSVPAGSTVGEALTEAELTLGSGDTVSPGLDESISSDNGSVVISRQNKIIITEGNATSCEVTVMGGTVADALEEAGIELGEYDILNHGMEAYLSDGMNINVTRRVAVELTVDGETEEIVTAADTVEELLEEQNITLGDKDKLSKDKTASLASGDKLVIERVNVKKVKETEEIAYETQVEYSDSMYAGQSSVKQEGINGEKELTYDVTYVDGVESERKLVSEEVITEPTDEIVVQGTKQADTSAGSNGKTVVSKEKNYDCDNSGHGWYTITYSDGSVEYIDF